MDRGVARRISTRATRELLSNAGSLGKQVQIKNGLSARQVEAAGLAKTYSPLFLRGTTKPIWAMGCAAAMGTGQRFSRSEFRDYVRSLRTGAEDL